MLKCLKDLPNQPQIFPVMGASTIQGHQVCWNQSEFLGSKKLYLLFDHILLNRLTFILHSAVLGDFVAQYYVQALVVYDFSGSSCVLPLILFILILFTSFESNKLYVYYVLFKNNIVC